MKIQTITGKTGRLAILVTALVASAIASPAWADHKPGHNKGGGDDDGGGGSGRSDKVEVCAWFEPLPGANILGVRSDGNVIDEYSDLMDPYCHSKKDNVHNVIGFRWGLNYNTKWPNHPGRQVYLSLPDSNGNVWVDRKFDGGKASVSTEYYFDSWQDESGNIFFDNWCYLNEVRDIDMPAMPTFYDFATRAEGDCFGTPEHPNPTLTALTFDFYAIEQDANGNEIEVTYRIRNGASRGRGCWSDPDTYGPCPDDPVVVTRVNQYLWVLEPMRDANGVPHAATYFKYNSDTGELLEGPFQSPVYWAIWLWDPADPNFPSDESDPAAAPWNVY